MQHYLSYTVVIRLRTRRLALKRRGRILNLRSRVDVWSASTNAISRAIAWKYSSCFIIVLRSAFIFTRKANKSSDASAVRPMPPFDGYSFLKRAICAYFWAISICILSPFSWRQKNNVAKNTEQIASWTCRAAKDRYNCRFTFLFQIYCNAQISPASADS